MLGTIVYRRVIDFGHCGSALRPLYVGAFVLFASRLVRCRGVRYGFGTLARLRSVVSWEGIARVVPCCGCKVPLLWTPPLYRHWFAGRAGAGIVGCCRQVLFARYV